VKLKAEHLANPQDLATAEAIYVVWFRQSGGTPVNEGQLRPNKDLEAGLQTTTPFKSFDVIVTAERDPAVPRPTGPEAMHGAVRP
jgi:hypothetical protein